MRMHVEALFAHDERGRLVRVNEPSGGDAPQFFLGRTRQGSECRFRYDVEEETALELEALCVDAPDADGSSPGWSDPSRYESVLARTAPVQKTWAGPVYCFPVDLPASSGTVLVTVENLDLLRPRMKDWIGDVATGQPFVAVVSHGQAVSICCSVRTTSAADEAGVETAVEFRGRGHAVDAVAAWGRAVRELGRTPLYSTSWGNLASQAVAAKVGLIRFGSDLHLT